MRAIGLLAMTMVLTSASPAFALETGGDTAKAEKKICRTESVTGSRTRTTRLCMTSAEWDKRAEQIREAASRYTRGAGQNDSIMAQSPPAYPGLIR